jgi:hypothetical protein
MPFNENAPAAQERSGAGHGKLSSMSSENDIATAAGVTKPIERKYALAKIEAGDWLLPGNDGKTLWRLVKSEDGPSYGLDPDTFPDDFTVWLAYKWEGRGRPETEDDLLLDGVQWSCHIQESSREEAIQAALRSEFPKPKPKHKPDPRPAGQILLEGAVGEAVADG